MIQTHIEDESKVSLALFPDCAQSMCVVGEDILPLLILEKVYFNTELKLFSYHAVRSG